MAPTAHNRAWSRGRRKGEMKKEKENKNCVEEIFGKNGVEEVKTETSHVVCLCF